MNNEEVILRDNELSLFGKKLNEWMDSAKTNIQRVSQETGITRTRIYRLMSLSESSALSYAEIISLSQILKRSSTEVLAVYYSSQQGLDAVPADLLQSSEAEMYLMTYLSLPPDKRQLQLALMETLLERAKNEDPQAIHEMLMSLPTMQALKKEPEIKGKPHPRKVRRGQPKPPPPTKEAEQPKEPPIN